MDSDSRSRAIGELMATASGPALLNLLQEMQCERLERITNLVLDDRDRLRLAVEVELLKILPGRLSEEAKKHVNRIKAAETRRDAPPGARIVSGGFKA